MPQIGDENKPEPAGIFMHITDSGVCSTLQYGLLYKDEIERMRRQRHRSVLHLILLFLRLHPVFCSDVVIVVCR